MGGHLTYNPKKGIWGVGGSSSSEGSFCGHPRPSELPPLYPFYRVRSFLRLLTCLYSLFRIPLVTSPTGLSESPTSLTEFSHSSTDRCDPGVFLPVSESSPSLTWTRSLVGFYLLPVLLNIILLIIMICPGIFYLFPSYGFTIPCSLRVLRTCRVSFFFNSSLVNMTGTTDFYVFHHLLLFEILK